MNRHVRCAIGVLARPAVVLLDGADGVELGGDGPAGSGHICGLHLMDHLAVDLELAPTLVVIDTEAPRRLEFLVRVGDESGLGRLAPATGRARHVDRQRPPIRALVVPDVFEVQFRPVVIRIGEERADGVRRHRR